MAENKLSVIQSAQTIEELDKIINKTKDLVTEFKDLNDVTDKVNAMFRSGIPKDYLEAVKKLDDFTIKYNASQKQIIALEKELERLRTKSKSQSPTIEKDAKATAMLREEKRLLNAEYKQQAQVELQASGRLSASLNLYNKLQLKYNATTVSLQNLLAKKQLGLKLTDSEVKSIDRLTAKQQKYDALLKSVDTSMGKYQRNVGNYASEFDPLSNSVNQLTREMPAFANSVQTGFMAISNNIPILFDAIGGIRAQNKALAAEGKATIPVWKQIAGSIFSWGTALSIAVTLLTVYGKDIVEFAQKLIFSNNAILQATKNQKELNKARQEGVKSAGEEISKLDTLYRVATNTNLAYEARMKAVRRLQDMYPSFFGNIEKEIILTGKASDKYLSLRNAILDSARARAIEGKLAERQSERLEEEEKQQAKIDEAIKEGVRIKKSGQKETEYISDKQGGLILKEVSNQELLSRQYYKINTLIRERGKANKKFYNDNSFLINEQIKLQNKENVALYESDKYGKDAPKEKALKDNSQKVMRDYLKDLEALRDEQLAINERAFVRLERSEQEYLTIAFNINQSFFKSKIAYLKGATAEERKLRSQAMLELEKNEKEYNANMFKLSSESYKKKLDDALYQINRNQKIIQENEQIGESQRNAQLIENVDERIKTQQDYYKSLINSAVKNKQQTIDIEREMFRVLNDLTDERLKLQQSGLDALRKDLDYIQNTLNNEGKLDNIALKRRIMSDTSLSAKQKELELNRLDLKISYDNLKQDQRRLENEKQRIKQNAFGRELTAKEREDISKINLELGEIGLKIDENAKNLDQLDFKNIVSSLQPAVDLITKGFQDMGLSHIADEFSNIYQRILDEGKDFKLSAEEIFKSAMMVVFDFANQLSERSKQQKIAALDEQLKHSQESTELEVSFIQSRLDALNNIQEKTQEQIEERNALEDEARVLKEQQLQREKMIATQKAKAEQQAAAQQALINGGVAATKTLAEMGFIPGIPYALASIVFGALQAGLIMARNPIPQYYVGTNYAQEGIAWTNERGAEIHTDKHGNIKDYGDNKGARLVKTEKGDKIYTASQTKRILSQLSEPNYEEMMFNNSVSPTFVNTRVDEEKLIKGFGKEYEKVAKKYDKPSNFVKDGEMYLQKGADIPIKIKSSESKIVVVKQTKVQRD